MHHPVKVTPSFIKILALIVEFVAKQLAYLREKSLQRLLGIHKNVTKHKTNSLMFCEFVCVPQEAAFDFPSQVS